MNKYTKWIVIGSGHGWCVSQILYDTQNVSSPHSNLNHFLKSFFFNYLTFFHKNPRHTPPYRIFVNLDRLRKSNPPQIPPFFSNEYAQTINRLMYRSTIYCLYRLFFLAVWPALTLIAPRGATSQREPVVLPFYSSGNIWEESTRKHQRLKVVFRLVILLRIEPAELSLWPLLEMFPKIIKKQL
jgi:hypothetical protein